MKRLAVSLFIISLFVLSGAPYAMAQENCVPAKRLNCSVPNGYGQWECSPISGGKSFSCQYDEVITDIIPDTCINDGGCYSTVIPECGVPIQGVDSCGNTCEISGSVCIEPDCLPTWCNLPMQSCDLPPLTNGTDSCGNSCSKPSLEWPACIEE